DKPINEDERAIVSLLNSKSRGNPYSNIKIGRLTEAEKKLFEKDKLEEIIRARLKKEQVDFAGLGWFLRRLSQVGAAGALEIVLKQIRKLAPVLSSAAKYISSASPNYEDDLAALGSQIIDTLEEPLVQRNEYLQITLLNLFSRVTKFDHTD